MSGYLLDTNEISKFAPGKPEVPDALSRWMHEHGARDHLFISAMTVAEITSGIRRLQRKGSTAKADALSRWLDGMLVMFEDRILPMDRDVSVLVGEMEDHIVSKGFEPGLADIIIAATARFHDLVLVTENTRRFEHLGIQFESPKR